MMHDIHGLWNVGPEFPKLEGEEFDECLSECRRVLSAAAGSDAALFSLNEDFCGSRDVSIYVDYPSSSSMPLVLGSIRRWLEQDRPHWRTVFTRTPGHPWAIVVDRLGITVAPVYPDPHPLAPTAPAVEFVLSAWATDF